MVILKRSTRGGGEKRAGKGNKIGRRGATTPAKQGDGETNGGKDRGPVQSPSNGDGRGKNHIDHWSITGVWRKLQSRTRKANFAANKVKRHQDRLYEKKKEGSAKIGDLQFAAAKKDQVGLGWKGVITFILR